MSETPLQKQWSKILGLDAIDEYKKKLIFASALAAGVLYYLTKKR